MSNARRLHIPHMITEFDENLLVPLADNFSAIQRHVALTQARVEVLEELSDAIFLALGSIETALEEILAELSTAST